ncbi:MAG: LamG-like jellyroll fold domain-containing protein [Candidatus Brocadiia bacterium]
MILCIVMLAGLVSAGATPGEPVIAGSELVTGWRRGDAETAPHISEPEKVWYADIPFAPRCAWEVRGDEVNRLKLARTPNWTVSNPDDVKSEWWTWDDVEKREAEDVPEGLFVGIDPEHLTREPEYYEGGHIWAEWEGVMGTPAPCRIVDFDPEKRGLVFRGRHERVRYTPHLRYYLEDNPRYLDEPGEFWFRREGDGGRLFVRLPDERDPNESRVEVARHLNLVDLENVSHVHVSGLTFRFTNVHWDMWAPDDGTRDIDNAAIRFWGEGRDLRVANCRFEHLAKAVHVQPLAEGDSIDEVVVRDNDIAWTDHGAIDILSGKRGFPDGRLGEVRIMRNRMFHVGFRPLAWPHHGQAVINTFPETAEIAGNILDRIFGAGLFLFGGKPSGSDRDAPLSRMLVHHNKVVDPLLGTNDWGGIETWQGGPFYVYSNISGNPGGYWHRNHVLRKDQPASERTHTTARFAFAYYLDGSFKNYVFNNVAWGKSNDLTSPLCNTSALQEVHSLQNTIFNNTIYKFAVGSRRQAPQAGRDAFLGSLWLDLSEWVFFHGRPARGEEAPNIEHVGPQSNVFAHETTAVARNIFHKLPREFAVFEADGTRHAAMETYRRALTQRGALAGDVGKAVEDSPVRDAEAHDFRLTADSPAIDYGVKTFVPWSLYGVVGEWQFRRNNVDPTRIIDDHWYLRPYYTRRESYYMMPRYPLTAVGVDADDYGLGPLEDWVDGALTLNGRDQYARCPAEDLSGDHTMEIRRRRRTRTLTVPEEERRTLDMDTNNFLIEAYLKTAEGHSGGLIAGKADEAGYILEVDDEGRVRLRLREGGRDAARRAGRTRINDGRWHHVIAEADRSAPDGIRIYVDGRLDSGRFVGAMPAGNLSSKADFLVGGGPGQTHLAGTLEFLRVARGTLEDAHTTIDELYEWEFNGPQFRDFAGNPVNGERRDAGAFEFTGP